MNWVIAIAVCYFVWVFIKAVKKHKYTSTKRSKLVSFNRLEDAYSVYENEIRKVIRDNLREIPEFPQDNVEEVVEAVYRAGIGGGNLPIVSKALEKFNFDKHYNAYVIHSSYFKANAFAERMRSIHNGNKYGRWSYVSGPVNNHKGALVSCKHKSLNNKRFLLTQGIYHKASDSYIFPGELNYCCCYLSPDIILT